MVPVTDRERRTFFLDSIRMGTDGVWISLHQTVILVIAISVFAASDLLKSVLASAPHIGQLLTLFVTAALAGTRLRPSVIAGILGAIAALALAGAAAVNSAAGFVALILIAMTMIQLRLPYTASIHERNYPAERRGRRFSIGLIMTVIVALTSDLVAGRLLETDVTLYRPLLGGAAAIVLAGSVALALVPSPASPVNESRNPFRNLDIVRQDALFRRLTVAWFILGFSNLWTVPLRVVYLAEAERGLGLSPLLVMLIGGVIPQATRLIFSRIWAGFFDRTHLVVIRMILALILGAGIFVFFATEILWVVIAGQVLINLAFAGGPILWNLWVTRIAPPGKSSVYMSVHTFMTGIRGTIGPALGFLATTALSFRQVGMISFAGTIVAALYLIPVLREPRAAAPSA